MFLTIKTRLVALVALTAVFISIIAANGLLELRGGNQRMKGMYEGDMVGINTLSRIGMLMRDNRIQLLLAVQHDPALETSKLHDHPVTQHLDQVYKNIEEISTVWNAYMKTIDREDAEQVKLAEAYTAKRGEFVNQGLKPCIAAIEAKEYQKAAEITLTRINPLAKEAIGLSDQLTDKEFSQASANFKKAESAYIRSVVVATLLLVATVGFAALVAFFVIRSITRSSGRLEEAAGRMAKGDLTARIEGIGNDEMGRVGAAFNTMSEEVARMISRVAATSGRIATAASQVYNSSEAMATGAEQVASQATTVATAGEEMSATSSDIAANCGMAAEASRQASSQAMNGATVVEGTAAIMNRIAERVKATSTTIETLGERSDQIGEIIGTIEDIADQTNLLALNAAIEAARAGEQGRGFAVVADEVRALAERTTKATHEIGNMIKTIQSETRAAVLTMEESVQNVEEGRKESSRSGASIRGILQQIDEVATQINQIATAAEEQTATTSEISSNMMQINEVVQGTARGAHESAQAARELNRIADELQGMVGQFKLS
ncbi:MAG TPA: methyl-accepting chemotaxis protein [Geobacter sp.]|nr:methyl-accepting chemotaxis protein [Geobacter sp.]